MRKLALLLVALCLVVGMSGTASAQLPQMAMFDWQPHGSISDTQITGVTVEFLDAGGAPIFGGGGALTYSGDDGVQYSWWTGNYAPPVGSVNTRMTATSNTLAFNWNPGVQATNFVIGNTITIQVQ